MLCLQVCLSGNVQGMRISLRALPVLHIYDWKRPIFDPLIQNLWTNTHLQGHVQHSFKPLKVYNLPISPCVIGIGNEHILMLCWVFRCFA